MKIPSIVIFKFLEHFRFFVLDAVWVLKEYKKKENKMKLLSFEQSLSESNSLPCRAHSKDKFTNRHITRNKMINFYFQDYLIFEKNNIWTQF